jgi:pSer/pThr/pTyr-binding forkhead associated (FHA) protein
MAFTALQIMSGGQQQLFSLERIRRVTVGRGPGADINLPDFFMRARQFEIYRVDHVDGPQYYVYDFGGKDDVRVNGRVVSNVRLYPGDVIETGGSLFSFRRQEELVVILPDGTRNWAA